MFCLTQDVLSLLFTFKMFFDIMYFKLLCLIVGQ